MRPAAQVQEGTVAVDRDHLVVLELLQPLELEGIVGEELPALLLAHAAALEGIVGGDDVAHAGLERLQVFGREGFVHLEVVVEAVLDRRAEADARGGMQLAHRGGEYVRGGVAQYRQGIFVPAGEDAHLRVLRHRASQVHRFAVHDGRQRGPGQSGADAGRDIGGAAAARHLHGTAVGKPHLDGFVRHLSSGDLRGFGCFGTTVAEHTRRNANCARRRQNGKEPGRPSPPGLPCVGPDQGAGRGSRASTCLRPFPPCRRRHRRAPSPPRAARPPRPRWSASGPRSKRRSAAPCAPPWWDR